ncbi:hypothetical protein NCS52_01259100 [Fusarium sp. LHS14.1]|nr:hypothetical protein NCS52_01259100 [Fusarium sp. LHS14.1]
MPPKVSMSVQAAQWTIDPQDSCPLFTRFPPEIRQEIFSCALSEHDSHFDIKGMPGVSFPIAEPKWLVCDLPANTPKPMPEHSILENIALDYYSPRENLVRDLYRRCPEWLSPGTSAARFQHTSLLRTCRRIFLEARDLLMKNATLRFFFGPCIPIEMGNAILRVHSRQQMTRYTANRLTSLEIYTHQLRLEHNFLNLLEQDKDLLCVEDLRITLYKGAWRKGSEIPGPHITPYGDCREDSGTDTYQLMKDHMALEKDHGQDRAPIPPFPYTRWQYGDGMSWGESLSKIPNLKRFTMVFEHSENHFQRIKELAQWAQHVWTFRLGGKMKGYYLSAKDNPIKMYSWRGLLSHMGVTIICPDEDCPKKSKDSEEDDSWDSDNPDEDDLYYIEKPECCAETYKRMRYGFGPRMYTFTVTWTARKLEPEDGDDPSILGPDELESKWPEGHDDILVPDTNPTVPWGGTFHDLISSIHGHERFQATRRQLE